MNRSHRETLLVKSVFSGVPACDGVVYEPEDEKYYLYTGEAVASKTQQIAYTANCKKTKRSYDLVNERQIDPFLFLFQNFISL